MNSYRTIDYRMGHPPDMERTAWAMRFGITITQLCRGIPDALCLQLCRCRSDEARRLILGVSR
jgi:hypothetical protein